MSRKFTNWHKPTSILVITIVLLLLITAVLAPTRLVFAATNINVTTTDDVVDAATTDIATLIANPGTDGQISLREAVLAANNTPGANVITLPSGTFNLSTGTFELQVGITPGSDITINGAGPTNTIIHQTVANQRVINLDPSVTGGVNVHISGVTISGGQGNTFGGGGVLGGGPQDNLAIDNVVFDSNSTVGINAGGAINFGADGNLTVTNSTFINNTAGGVGGAINFLNNASPAYTLTVQNSVFDNNTSGGNLSTGGQGGAINMAGTNSTFNISGSTFTNNTATGGSSQGGAIHIDSGQLSFNHNRVAGNQASVGTGLFTNGGSGGPTINATQNWWGCNAGPAQTECDIVTGISSASFTPWIVMELSANPSSINSNATSTATVSFLKDSNGGAVPAGLSGTSVTWGSPVLGTLSGQQTTIQSNGTATATFTAGSTGGSGSVSATVDNTTLTANITITQPPIVTTHPASQTICEGAEITLTAAASGLPEPAIQWQISTTSGATWTSMIGQTNDNLTIAPLASQSGFQYRVVFVNTHGTATTDPAIVTVNYAPSITTQPVDQTVSAGGTASFSAAALGDPNPAAQWQVSTDNGGTWINISGATGPTLSFTAAQGDNGKQYRVIFTNGCNSDTSNAVTLTVQGQVAPSITTQPVNQTICEGANASFTAAASGNPTPTVQWQTSIDSGATWTDISGATNPTLNFAAAANHSGNQFRAVFTNAVGPVTTNAAALTVSTDPEITTQPINQTVSVGQSVTFTSAAAGSPAPSVQWQVSTDNGDSWQDIPGATSATLTFMAAAGDDGNRYRADYTNACNITTTNSATLTVQTQVGPSITTQPVDQTICEGANVSFSTAATGSPAPTVQWQISTDSGTTWTDISGATNPILTFAAAANQSGNQYRAVFTNIVGPVTTNAAALTVSTAPEITTHPTNQTVAVGQPVTFTSAAAGSPAPSVQWQVSADNGDSWQDIPGATSPTLTFVAAAGDDGNRYRADYTNNCNIETTNAATLSLSAQATTVTISQPAAAQYSDPLTLIATVAPTSSGTVEFFINAASVGAAPVGASGVATLANVANPRPAGSYSITATFTSSSPQFTGSTASAVNLSITQEDAALVYSGANTAKVGTNLSLKATAYDSAASGFRYQRRPIARDDNWRYHQDVGGLRYLSSRQLRHGFAAYHQIRQCDRFGPGG